jgi:hypothetical protein
MVLTFGRTAAGQALQFTAVTADGSTLLAAGSLLLRLGGRRQERFGWDEAAHAEVRVVSLPEPSAEGLALYHAPHGISTSGESLFCHRWHAFFMCNSACPELQLTRRRVPVLCIECLAMPKR